MALPSVTALNIENNLFPPTVTPPGSTNNFFLGGAGERGLQIQDKFVKFTAIGVYLQDIAVPYLATKWKGKTAQELTETVPFFRDIVTGTFTYLHTSTLFLCQCQGYFCKFISMFHSLFSVCLVLR
jgi:chalcone isomerase